ncbi:MAG TPA: LysR family transcriptional regulator, partial [Reyranella sp.]|nr:LysR family transcriptional regulator [Reyranella sp.]
PPLNALRSFEAAARHLSFTRAADELCVTPGAVSQQVKALEKALGVTLFRRLTRSLVLTDDGEVYLPAIQSAFAIITKATDSIAPALRGRALRLGVSPQIVQMAAPAVRKLRQAGKETVTVKVSDDLAELLKGKLDALLRVSGSSYPGLHVDRLALAGVDATQTPIVLLTHPGLAGCREHRGLLRRLKEMA